jgi:hypothetical protein
MSIQDIGSLGEFVAALATVITLVYLSAQIKQTNLITKAEFGHGLTHRLYDRSSVKIGRRKTLKIVKSLVLLGFLSCSW